MTSTALQAHPDVAATARALVMVDDDRVDAEALAEALYAEGWHRDYDTCLHDVEQDPDRIVLGPHNWDEWRGPDELPAESDVRDGLRALDDLHRGHDDRLPARLCATCGPLARVLESVSA